MNSKNLILHAHRNLISFYLWYIKKGDIELVHIDIKYQIIDIFIKPLTTQQHGELRFKLDMFEPP
jgi:hypothetical protein